MSESLYYMYTLYSPLQTVVCPHKLLTGGEVVLQLPLGSTHIKVTQPVVQLVGGAKATPTGRKSGKVVTPRAGQYYLVSFGNMVWHRSSAKISRPGKA